MPSITFSHAKKTLEAEVGEWLYDVVERAGGDIPFSCKAGACGTCATEVLAGREHMGEQSAREIRTLTAADLDPGVFRLPCLGDVHGDIVFGRPQAAGDTGTALPVHEVTVECSRPLTATVAEVRFFVTSGELSFRPGQYMIFHIPDAERRLRRSYSISTPPSDRRHFEVCVRALAGGAGSNFIHRLRTGRRLRVEGPYGEFILQEGSGKEILMIATGTGISPIKSMLINLLDTKSSRRIRLFFGVRHEQELFYTDFCRGLASRYPEFSYRITLSAPSEAWHGQRGRVTDLVDSLVHPAEASATEVYLCGGRQMIEDCAQRLVAKGFGGSAIHYENFY